MFRKILFIGSFILMANCTIAQVELTWFNVVQLKEKVQLKWELASGNTCNGIQVYRSSNGNDFFYIGEIEGVCGSPTVAQQFIFDDVSPLPFQTNYYKLIFGSGQHSQVLSIYFYYVQTGYFYIENPLSSNSQLYLKQGEKFKIAFLTADGKKIIETQPSSDRIYLGDFFSLLPKGILFLYIEAENGNSATYRLLNP